MKLKEKSDKSGIIISNKYEFNTKHGPLGIQLWAYILMCHLQWVLLGPLSLQSSFKMIFFRRITISMSLLIQIILHLLQAWQIKLWQLEAMHHTLSQLLLNLNLRQSPLSILLSLHGLLSAPQEMYLRFLLP